jgi:exosortase
MEAVESIREAIRWRLEGRRRRRTTRKMSRTAWRSLHSEAFEFSRRGLSAQKKALESTAPLQSDSRSMSVETSVRPSLLEEFRRDFPAVWRRIPYKGLFTLLLTLWVLLFEFVGNSTFGYINTHSLFGWTSYAYLSSPDDEHGFYIPLVVLGLFWWKRRDFEGLAARPWPPGLVLVIAALLLHVAGYLAQQTRISLAAFYFGLYALIGIAWGPRVLRASFFPMCLFAFALPLGTLAETITFPLRLFAVWINVVHQGTLIFDPSGAFQYEVAAACGGLRSLTAVLALCTIYGFLSFRKASNRLFLFLAGFPLAIAGNMTRLLMIIIVSEAFGRNTGAAVHDSTFFSLIPYVPPIIGIIVLGHLLREQKGPKVVEPRGFSGSAEATAIP